MLQRAQLHQYLKQPQVLDLFCCSWKDKLGFEAVERPCSECGSLRLQIEAFLKAVMQQ